MCETGTRISESPYPLNSEDGRVLTVALIALVPPNPRVVVFGVEAPTCSACSVRLPLDNRVQYDKVDTSVSGVSAASRMNLMCSRVVGSFACCKHRCVFQRRSALVMDVSAMWLRLEE